jgi:hypothetical protein
MTQAIARGAQSAGASTWAASEASVALSAEGGAASVDEAGASLGAGASLEASVPAAGASTGAASGAASVAASLVGGGVGFASVADWGVLHTVVVAWL